MMRSYHEVFETNTLVPKSNEELNKEEFLLGGYKTTKELRETEPELFFGDYIRLTDACEVNGTRFCFAAYLGGGMKQHPYTQWEYWVPVRFVFFNRKEYGKDKKVKWVNIPFNMMLWRLEDADGKRFETFLNRRVASMGNKTLLDATLRSEGKRFEKVICEIFETDIETVQKSFK